jgi:hypothetical protein
LTKTFSLSQAKIPQIMGFGKYLVLALAVINGKQCSAEGK